MASKHIYGAKIWAAGMFAAGIWRGIAAWDPTANCPIAAGVTMPANTISGDVTMTEATNSWNVTMPASSVTGDIGIGCGHQS